MNTLILWSCDIKLPIAGPEAAYWKSTPEMDGLGGCRWLNYLLISQPMNQ